MIIEKLIFYFCITLATVSSLGVITLRNPVKAVLSLIITFFATALVWLLLRAEFLAMTLIIVYIGAVMILFLFVLMLLNWNNGDRSARFVSYLPLGVCVSVLLAILLIYVMGPYDFSINTDYILIGFQLKQLADMLYTKYLLCIEVAGCLLLVGIIGAIALAMRGPMQRKQQSIKWQQSVSKQDRLTLIKDES